MTSLHIAIIIGTRPEAIKLAPLVLAARKRPDSFRVSVVRTGQHLELVDQVMAEFGLAADVDLKIMRPDQDLAHVMAESVRGLSDYFAKRRPDWAIVQGDTTTTLAGALAAFYNRVRVGYVEAGLRSGTRHTPFPEETSRRLTSRLADLHFAPTYGARDNLLAEGHSLAEIIVTGNTVIDALRHALDTAGDGQPTPVAGVPYVLVTVHRRENHGAGLERVCTALLSLLDRQPALWAWLPMHPSPAVRKVLQERLGRHPRIRLTEPLGYRAFVVALKGCVLVLTDSGGIQEECAALGKPVLVLRDQTERPEAVTAGVAILVGTDPEHIVATAQGVLNCELTREVMSQPSAAFGSGDASSRILDALLTTRTD